MAPPLPRAPVLHSVAPRAVITSRKKSYSKISLPVDNPHRRCSALVSRQYLHTQTESHPKNLHLQAQHRILTGVPHPGPYRPLVRAVKGTSFKFSAATISSFVSVLPHSGQRAEKTLSFGGRFRFVGDARMTANDQAQRPPPETPGRLQQSRTNYLNRSTAQRGGGSLQRPG